MYENELLLNLPSKEKEKKFSSKCAVNCGLYDEK